MHVAGHTLAARLSFLAVLSFGIAAKAQKTDLPAAPSAPSAPPLRLDLSVPTSTPVLPADTKKPAPPSLPYIEEAACEKAMTETFAKNPGLRPRETPAMKVYVDEAFQHLRTEWSHHMPRDARNPWINGKIVAVRFFIKPDGNIDDVEIVASSGRSSYDDHALDAISASAPFPPLPTSNNRPIPVCITLAYNLDMPKRVDLWPAAKAEQKKPEPGNPPAAAPAK